MRNNDELAIEDWLQSLRDGSADEDLPTSRLSVGDEASGADLSLESECETLSLLDDQVTSVRATCEPVRVTSALCRNLSQLRDVMDSIERRGGSHSVYVVELDPRVAREKAFKQQNPDYRTGSSCLYVGRTGLDVEERFANHLAGHKSSRAVKHYGVRLAYDLFQDLNPMSYEMSERVEIVLAYVLRRHGFGVWQN